jgi:HAD superfamily hydrolase (TIGR01509 family)
VSVALVLFDVDGTLIDSRPAIVAAYRHAFNTVLGIEHPRSDDEVRELLAPRLREVCELVAGDQADACVEAYNRFYLEEAEELVAALPGTQELLAALVDRGIAIGLVTNKGRERIGPDLRRAGLDGFPLAAVICSEDTENRKPHPAPIEAALRRAGREPASAVYVGDGPQDVLAARAAGVPAVGAAYGYYGAAHLDAVTPDVLISAPGELLVHLDGIGVPEVSR